jgi:predicted O-linked N-acetylglucosamine transferase (SPINDLY family)
MPSIEELLAQGARCYQQGRWAEADHLLRAVLGAAPGHTAALHLLGLMALQGNLPALATDYWQRAVASQPANPELLSLLGSAWHARGRLDDAVGCFRRALEIDPEHSMGLNNLGITLTAQGHLDEAIAVFEKARARVPDDAGTLTNLAAALRARGDVPAAAALFREAIRLAPRLPQPHNNLGNLCQDLGLFAEAEACYRRAIAVAPLFALAHANLGGLLASRGRLTEAIAAYRQALQLDPTNSTAAGRLTAVLLQLNRVAEALAVCQEALRRTPQDAELLNVLGNALAAQGRLDEAAEPYRRAVERRPDWSVPHYNLGLNLLNQGRLAEARASLEEALRLAPDDPVTHSTYVGSFLYDPAADAATLLEQPRRWVERHTRHLPPPAPHTNNPDPERRLRVGYVSPDFRSHAAAFFLEPILAHHDPARVEVFCYAEVTAPDEVTARLRRLVPQWCDTPGLSDDELAGRIRSDGIDVLVELCGHMAYNRLLTFARRPAPVQVSYLGYPATSGLPAIPYRLADAVTASPGEPLSVGEELVILPGLFCCYAPPPALRIEPQPPSRRSGVITFGSLHKLCKLNAAVLDVWARLLREVSGSRLLLCRSTLQAATLGWFRGQFARRGVAPERIACGQVETGGMRHLLCYNEIDVALDSFPWSGHTTACEALWMGVPVVTLRGDRYAGRMTASVLDALDLSAWAAATADEYVRVAGELARDEARRATLRRELRSRLEGSSLCDGARFVRGWEEVCRRLWRRWCAVPTAAWPLGAV